MEAILEAITSLSKSLDNKRGREKGYFNEPQSYVVWNLQNRAFDVSANSYSLSTTFHPFMLIHEDGAKMFGKNLLSRVIEEIRTLEYNWDGYGAIAPLPLIINKTEVFLRTLPTYITDSLNENGIYPNPNGTITVEWEKNNNLVSVELGLNTANYFTRINSEYGGEEGLDSIETKVPSTLVQSIRKVIA
jgi:hypothetical protein